MQHSQLWESVLRRSDRRCLTVAKEQSCSVNAPKLWSWLCIWMSCGLRIPMPYRCKPVSGCVRNRGFAVKVGRRGLVGLNTMFRYHQLSWPSLPSETNFPGESGVSIGYQIRMYTYPILICRRNARTVLTGPRRCTQLQLFATSVVPKGSHQGSYLHALTSLGTPQ